MRKIPSSFHIGSLTFKVTRATGDEIEKRAGKPAYGLFIPDSQEILVHRAGKDCSAELARQTFFHELSHAILWVMSHKDCTNEKVTDQLGHILKQFADTAK